MRGIRIMISLRVVNEHVNERGQGKDIDPIEMSSKTGDGIMYVIDERSFHYTFMI